MGMQVGLRLRSPAVGAQGLGLRMAGRWQGSLRAMPQVLLSLGTWAVDAAHRMFFASLLLPVV